MKMALLHVDDISYVGKCYFRSGTMMWGRSAAK